MNAVRVVGLGPGDRGYILPAAVTAIEEADILVGASRHLDALRVYGKQTFAVEGRFAEMAAYIAGNARTHRIAVVVSGDTGFYSLLRYLKDNLPDMTYEIIPGLSAMSLMFARLGLMHDDAFTGSVHGKALDVAALVKEHKKVGLLTDGKTAPAVIAMKLLEQGIQNKSMAIGERLSYADEKISILSLEQAADYAADALSIVVIYDEDVHI